MMRDTDPEHTDYTNNEIMHMLNEINEKLNRLESSSNNPIGYLFDSIFTILVVSVMYHIMYNQN